MTTPRKRRRPPTCRLQSPAPKRETIAWLTARLSIPKSAFTARAGENGQVADGPSAAVLRITSLMSALAGRPPKICQSASGPNSDIALVKLASFRSCGTWPRGSSVDQHEIGRYFDHRLAMAKAKLNHTTMFWCGRRDSNPHTHRARDFKSRASTNFATSA
jgi:hypothetical protein